MTDNQAWRKRIRDLLHKFEVEDDYYEFTDAGVWVTDKAVDEVLELLTKAGLESDSEK